MNARTDQEFEPLERWLAAALETMEPRRRKTILSSVARELRKRNQRRISKQSGPDGAAWAPRKRDAAGRVRSTAKMLQGLRQVRRLTLKAGPDGAEIGYSGRTARIAAVHHLGEVDAVAEGGVTVKYQARELLGLPADDVAFVRHRVLTELEKETRP